MRLHNKIFWFIAIFLMRYVVQTVAYVIFTIFHIHVAYAADAVDLVYALFAAMAIYIILRTTKISARSVLHGQSRRKIAIYILSTIILLVLLLPSVWEGETLKTFRLFHSSNPVFWDVVFSSLEAGIYEEFTSRGLLFNIFQTATSRSRFTLLWSSLASSAIFALIHLLNFFSGQDIVATLQQCIYAFALGMALAFLRVVSNGLALPVITHFLFDFKYEVTTVSTSSPWSDILMMLCIWLIPAVLLLAFMPARKHVSETAKLTEK